MYFSKFSVLISIILITKSYCSQREDNMEDFLTANFMSSSIRKRETLISNIEPEGIQENQENNIDYQKNTDSILHFIQLIFENNTLQNLQDTFSFSKIERDILLLNRILNVTIRSLTFLNKYVLPNQPQKDYTPNHFPELHFTHSGDKDGEESVQEIPESIVTIADYLAAYPVTRDFQEDGPISSVLSDVSNKDKRSEVTDRNEKSTTKPVNFNPKPIPFGSTYRPYYVVPTTTGNSLKEVQEHQESQGFQIFNAGKPVPNKMTFNPKGSSQDVDRLLMKLIQNENNFRKIVGDVTDDEYEEHDGDVEFSID